MVFLIGGCRSSFIVCGGSVDQGSGFRDQELGFRDQERRKL